MINETLLARIDNYVHSTNKMIKEIRKFENKIYIEYEVDPILGYIDTQLEEFIIDIIGFPVGDITTTVDPDLTTRKLEFTVPVVQIDKIRNRMSRFLPHIKVTL